MFVVVVTVEVDVVATELLVVVVVSAAGAVVVVVVSTGFVVDVVVVTALISMKPSIAITLAVMSLPLSPETQSEPLAHFTGYLPAGVFSGTV